MEETASGRDGRQGEASAQRVSRLVPRRIESHPKGIGGCRWGWYRCDASASFWAAKLYEMWPGWPCSLSSSTFSHDTHPDLSVSQPRFNVAHEPSHSISEDCAGLFPSDPIVGHVVTPDLCRFPLSAFDSFSVARKSSALHEQDGGMTTVAQSSMLSYEQSPWSSRPTKPP